MLLWWELFCSNRPCVQPGASGLVFQPDLYTEAQARSPWRSRDMVRQTGPPGPLVTPRLDSGAAAAANDSLRLALPACAAPGEGGGGPSDTLEAVLGSRGAAAGRRETVCNSRVAKASAVGLQMPQPARHSSAQPDQESAFWKVFLSKGMLGIAHRSTADLTHHGILRGKPIPPYGRIHIMRRALLKERRGQRSRWGIYLRTALLNSLSTE
ncbi:hypothetical protein SKAU_G00130240 [Synaphobranchus kaupii]|uniref:Uncharacterized protein n=1 Tax=Synaphobranchus kaupii TaxID=118154 RepID=A0A9Q1FR96_SYNKA|nr:hypothetical protein SKAU_G00130240 [Synaphobranchus kaupii]